jgi:hypothetical protein
MGMNLQSELEPLLSQLYPLVERMVQEAVRERTMNLAESEQTRQYNDELNGVYNELSRVIARFRSYYSLDEYDLSPVGDQFVQEGDKFVQPGHWASGGSSVFGNIAGAEDSVYNEVGKLIGAGWAGKDPSGGWSGNAANSFRANFLNPFQPAAYVHGLGATQLAAAAHGLAAKIELTKKSLVWICKVMLNFAHGSEHPGPAPTEFEGEGGEDSKRKLAAVGAIVADSIALLVALPELAPLDIGLAVAGVALGGFAESGGPDGWTATFDPPSTSEDYVGLIESALRAMDRIDAHNAAADEEIAGGLEKDLGADGPFGGNLGKLKPSNLKASDFDRFTGASDHVPGVAYDAVVVNVVMLYRAGSVILPQAADKYDAGAKVCAGAHIVGAEKQFPRSVPKFNEAAGRLGETMTQIRDDLERAGDALKAAAKNYQYADAVDAEQYKMLERQIDETENPTSPMYNQYRPPMPDDIYR